MKQNYLLTSPYLIAPLKMQSKASNKKNMKKNLANFGIALSRDEAKKVIGGDGEGVSCHCMEGGSVGTSNCANCARYCSTRGGQSSTSDCCVGGVVVEVDAP